MAAPLPPPCFAPAAAPIAAPAAADVTADFRAGGDGDSVPGFERLQGVYLEALVLLDFRGVQFVFQAHQESRTSRDGRCRLGGRRRLLLCEGFVHGGSQQYRGQGHHPRGKTARSIHPGSPRNNL
jgi:hypothetical protein